MSKPLFLTLFNELVRIVILFFVFYITNFFEANYTLAQYDAHKLTMEMKNDIIHIDTYPNPNDINSIHTSLISASLAIESDKSIYEININLGPHIYRIDRPIDFPSFSNPNVSINMVGFPGQTIVSGAKKFRLREDHNAPYVHALADNIKIYAANLGARVSSQFENGDDRIGPPLPHHTMPFVSRSSELMKIAQYPNNQLLNFSHSENNGNILQINHELPFDLDDYITVQGFFKHDWADSIISRVRLNGKLRRITLPKNIKKDFIGENGRIVLSNNILFLDSTTEYFVDVDSEKIYAIVDGQENNIEISYTESIIQETGIERLTLRGIVFEHARSSIINISGNQIKIIECEFRFSGGFGVRLEGDNNLVSKSLIHSVGTIGLILSGGNRHELRRANSITIETRVEKTGLRAWGYVPAVGIYGVGNSFLFSEISGSPYIGLSFYGNDHLIFGNSVAQVMQVSGDGGAIYSGRDWTARGNIIAKNGISDVRGVQPEWGSGIYLDDQLSGTIVVDNNLSNVTRGALIGGGRDNYLLLNRIHSNTCYSLDARGLTWQSKATLDEEGELQTRLRSVPYNSDPYITRYPNLRNINVGNFGIPAGNFVLGNEGRCKRAPVSASVILSSSIQKSIFSRW